MSGYGVPILLKDLGSGLAGRRQESGSTLFKDHTVGATDPLVDNYLSAGLRRPSLLGAFLSGSASTSSYSPSTASICGSIRVTASAACAHSSFGVIFLARTS